MKTALGKEIKQTRPFASPEEEAFLNIMRTSALLQHAVAESIKPFGVTQVQYNVLRILRGAGESGLCRHEVRDRMVTPVPDVTRLLDRLQDRGLVTRERDAVDRRLVTATITDDGLELLKAVDRPLATTTRRLLGHMDERDLKRLGELLVLARERV
jgi:DNA-binding MarR family transcriptional regulator